VSPVHVEPSAQAAQAPLLQTIPLPQTLAVPSATVPVAVHTAVPVEQDTLPVWQGLSFGLQLLPSGQAPHVPLLQNCPLPQVLPLSAGLHVPVEHELQLPQVVWQQIPEIQFPFWHSPSAAQEPPSASFGLHVPEAQ
jgi:hypothetical protein